MSEPKISFKNFALLLALILLFVLVGILFFSVYHLSKTGEKNPVSICMTPEQNYLLNCNVSGGMMQITATQENLQQALNDPKYNCSVDRSYPVFSVAFCNASSSSTQYEISLKKFS